MFHLRERGRPARVFSEDLEIHLVELPKFNLTADQLETQLDRWCYYFRQAEELDLANLPPRLDVPPIRRAMEELTMWYTKEDHEYERRERKYLAELDARTWAAYYKEKALEAEGKIKEAEDKARDEGVKKGKLIGQIRLLQELTKQPVTPEADLVPLSVEELAARLTVLKQTPATNGH